MTHLTIFKLFIFIWALAGLTNSWSATSNRMEQKQSAAESERSELRKKLNDLKKNIQGTESAKQHAEDELAESEEAISDTNRQLYGLTKEQKQIERKLSELNEQQQQLQTEIEQQKKQFSTLLRQQYETGNTDRTKLLLSGDNPNNINRDLSYLGYISQGQHHLIEGLRTNLAAVEENKLATEQTKKQLDEIAFKQQQQKSDLETEQKKRADLIKKLAGKLSAQRKEAGQLQKNEQRLSELVTRLNQLIAEQRKAQQEKRRAHQLAVAEKLKAVRANSGQAPSASKQAPLQITETPEADSGAGFNFAQLKGRLRLPTIGELTSKYGTRRSEGALWKGLFIRANEGAEIKSIAAGKVVFAEWLRGFGNLIILDHGSQYMSIYGNNQSLLKRAGEVVNIGDIIATAGNSGGNEQTGLYFELRFQGKPFDPLSWINLK